MRWTNEDIEYLSARYSTSDSIESICQRLSKTKRAVLHKAARLGLSRLIIPHNKPKDPFYRRAIDRKYYEENKTKIYRAKRQRVLKYKQDLVDALGGSCKMCGYNKSLAGFDFHHSNGNKEGSIGILLNWASKEKILKEAKKCTLLCANCHRELHYKGV